MLSSLRASGAPALQRQRAFWAANQPGFRFTDAEPGTQDFYDAVRNHRYALEPHLRDMLGFDRWSGRDVLEVGCGIATDGEEFVKGGARYIGVDHSDSAVALARRRFDLLGADVEIHQASALDLPFGAERFDYVFSHGVLHHIDEAGGAIGEIRRVLRPGGVALVMLYHRTSLNYRFTILGVRRALAACLLVPGASTLVSRLTGEDPAVLKGHRELLHRHGLRYLTDTQLFLSNNTDGPGNPLSMVFSREEAKRLFVGFEDVATTVRYLNLRLYPGGGRLAASVIGRTLERRIGWHMYVVGRKP